jgi:hypothetical protein
MESLGFGMAITGLVPVSVFGNDMIMVGDGLSDHVDETEVERVQEGRQLSTRLEPWFWHSS